MPTGPQRTPYPKTPEEAKGTSWEGAHRLYGAGSADALFKGAPKVVAPWPAAGRQKSNPKGYNQGLVDSALANPAPHVTQMDPRHLHATQPWVTSEATHYYMGDKYRETGTTFADQHQAGNKQPVVYTDAQGRNKILSGHHRATSALLRGEQFHAINVREPSE